MGEILIMESDKKLRFGRTSAYNRCREICPPADKDGNLAVKDNSFKEKFGLRNVVARPAVHDDAFCGKNLFGEDKDRVHGFVDGFMCQPGYGSYDRYAKWEESKGQWNIPYGTGVEGMVCCDPQDKDPKENDLNNKMGENYCQRP